MEFEAWNANEPNNYGSGEDCAVMKCPQWYDGCFWNDVPCSLKYRPICGKERIYPYTTFPLRGSEEYTIYYS